MKYVFVILMLAGCQVLTDEQRVSSLKETAELMCIKSCSNIREFYTGVIEIHRDRELPVCKCESN